MHVTYFPVRSSVSQHPQHTHMHAQTHIGQTLRFYFSSLGLSLRSDKFLSYTSDLHIHATHTHTHILVLQNHTILSLLLIPRTKKRGMLFAHVFLYSLEALWVNTVWATIAAMSLLLPCLYLHMQTLGSTGLKKESDYSGRIFLSSEAHSCHGLRIFRSSEGYCVNKWSCAIT